MHAGDLLVTTVAGLELGLQHHDPGPVGEPVQSGIGGNEALLRGLFGHPHALPDHRPRCARPPGLVDEVPDQMVSEVIQVTR